MTHHDQTPAHLDSPNEEIRSKFPRKRIAEAKVTLSEGYRQEETGTIAILQGLVSSDTLLPLFVHCTV
jgi:hypothetical protein